MRIQALFFLGLALLLGACSDNNDNHSSTVSFADEPGQLAAGTRTDIVLRDTARERDITATLWYPTDGPNQGALAAQEGAPVVAGNERFPVVVLVHGITDNAGSWDYMGPHLASHGYLVLAPSTGSSPATGSDVINHPGDISFLVDAALGVNDTLPLFAGRADENDILVGGFSFGGLATFLLAYEPGNQDDRVDAVVIFAGAHTLAQPVNPLLDVMFIYGTDDPLVTYESGLNLYEAADTPKHFVTLYGAGHVGFSSSVETNGAGTMDHLRQKSIARITLLAFLESLFADSERQRAAARRFLDEELARDNTDVGVMFER